MYQRFYSMVRLSRLCDAKKRSLKETQAWQISLFFCLTVIDSFFSLSKVALVICLPLTLGSERT